MMLIQAILIIVIALVLLRFLGSRNSSQTQAWKKMFLAFFGIAAVIFIISPNLLDHIAHAVGVGRGADLLLYGLTVAFVFGQLNSYVKSKEEQKRIVILARKIAIAEALHNKDTDNG